MDSMMSRWYALLFLLLQLSGEVELGDSNNDALLDTYVDSTDRCLAQNDVEHPVCLLSDRYEFWMGKKNFSDANAKHKSIDFLDKPYLSNDQVETVVSRLGANMSMGEKRRFNLSSLKMTLEKLSAKNLFDGHYFIQSGDTQIRFPPLKKNLINQSTILINLMTYGSSKMTLSLHDEYGVEIPIEDTVKPFDIRIKNENNLLVLPKLRFNATARSKSINYHFLNLTHSKDQPISIHIELQPENANLSYFYMIKFQGLPVWRKKNFNSSKLLCPQDRLDSTTNYTFFLDNTVVADHQWAVLAIQELPACDENLINQPKKFSSDYSLGIFLSGCYYLDDNEQWQSNDLRVGPETNQDFTQCLSTHLSTYAAGFVVLPRPIDFKHLDPDFMHNITLYVTLILIFIIFCGTMGYSYFKDLVDAKLLLVMPMADNNPRDKYLYQLVVYTGMRAHAGTKSKVHFILSGDNDETSIRTLNGGDRPILARGQCDSFIVAVPRPLGPLNYVRIWHDNSGQGSDASWFLKYIVVRDLQTMETSYFICQNWFAVEKGSGEIDRTLTVASELEISELKHILSKNAYRSMADNHLWFSIFAYHLPSAKRFTRIQRCTCCFVLLLMSLLMKILYYDQQRELDENTTDRYEFRFGPFTISKKEIMIGFLVEVIVFFPSLVLVALFRRSKARHPQTVSPVVEAIERIQKVKIPQKSWASEKKFMLPWWCSIVAYVLSGLIMLTCSVFIAIRGIQFGDEFTRQWLGSVITGFLSSIFVLQPLKVLSLALLFMFFARKKFQGEAFIEYEDPVADFTVSTVDANRKFPTKSILAQTYFDPERSRREQERLKELRAIRMKEVHSWFILRELTFLLVFLGVLFALCYANRDVHQAHQMVEYLRHQFLQVDYRIEGEYSFSKDPPSTFVFTNIRSINHYWNWLETIFIRRIREMVWNDSSNNKNQSKPFQKTLLIVKPMLRQLRVKNISCPRKVLKDHITLKDCHLPYKWYNEDKEPFGSAFNGSQALRLAFRYRSGDELGTWIYSTSHATYMAGGYVYNLRPGNLLNMQQAIGHLRNQSWIDQYTRAVFLTFGLYNGNTNLFVHCSLLLEQLPITGELVLRASFQPFKLTELYTGAELIYCLIYLILIIYNIYEELKLFLEKRRAYIRQFWSYINWTIIICSWIAVGVHVYRENERKRMNSQLNNKQRKQTVNLQFFAYLDSFLIYLLGFCCFFGTLKILRLLRFNRRMSLLHLTLKKSARQLLGFLLMASFIFFAFTTLFYLLFHSHLKQYSTWSDTSKTCFEMISLHFSSVKDLSAIDPLLVGVCLFLFIFLAVFLLSNMFISIIVDNFNEIRSQESQRPNDIELIQFLKNQVKLWLGRTTRKPQPEPILRPTAELPRKIDKLTFTVDKVFKNQ